MMANLNMLKVFIFFVVMLSFPFNVSVYAQGVYDTATTIFGATDTMSVSDDDEYQEEMPSHEFEKPDTATYPNNWRSLTGGYIDSLEKDEAFAYVKNGIAAPEEKEEKKPFQFNSIFFYIALAVFAGFLIWYLIQNSFISFRKKTKALAEDENSEELPEDIFSIEYRQAIQKALQDKNFRLAIRLQYLQLLKTLTDKKIISYRPDKTNFDYLMQLRPTDYYNDFFNITRNYEYSWYGLFHINELQYKQIESGIKKFFDRLI